MASFRFQSGPPVTVTGKEILLDMCLREEFKDLSSADMVALMQRIALFAAVFSRGISAMASP